MAATAQLHYTVSLPAIDKVFFAELLKKTRWVAAPITQTITTKKTVAKQKKMSIAELYAFAEEVDRINNPDGLEITPEEIDAIIEECRNGK